MKALLYQEFIGSLRKYFISSFFVTLLAYFIYFFISSYYNVTPVVLKNINESFTISINSNASSFALKKSNQKYELVDKHSYKKTDKSKQINTLKTNNISNVGHEESTIVSKISPDDYLQKAQIKYPRRAMNNGFEGTVVFNVVVSFDAKILQINMISSSGYDSLDRNALNSIKKWKFKPFSGSKQKTFQVPIEFKLE